MNPMLMNFLVFMGNLAFFLTTIILLVLSKEGITFLNARMSKKPIIFEFNPVTRSFRVRIAKNETLYEDKENIYFLGNTTAYKYGNVPVFLVIKGNTPTIEPDVIAEVQKSLSANVTTYEQLVDVVKNSLLEERKAENVVQTPEGPKKVVEKYMVLKPLMTTAHRVVNFRIKKGKKGAVDATFDLEVYEPLNVEVVTNYFGRNLSSTSIKKILDFRDLMWAEKTRKVYEKLKGLKGKATGGVGFNPVWLIYLAIAAFVVLLGWSMYGGGHMTALPNTPPTP